MLRTLLQIHRTELRNRIRVGGGPAVVLGGALLGALALGGAVFVLGSRVVADGPADPQAFADALFERTFWVNALVAFGMGFTTFEALFRSAEGRRLESLPIPGRTLFADRALAVAAWHAPLLLLALAFHAPLLGDRPLLFAYAAVVHGTSWALVVAVGTWLHVMAGRSLLTGGSLLKEFLGSGFHTNDAAMVLYSPGAAFAVAVFASVPIGLVSRPLALVGVAGPTLALLGVVAVVCAVALWKARAVYARDWRFIRARFTEAEVLRPWREHDLPRRVPGAFVERWLRPPLRGLYHKDLVQLRRRHRVDLALLAAAIAGVALFHLRTALDAHALFAWDAALLLVAIGAALSPAYKLAARELEPDGFLRALPVPLAAVRRAKALAALTHQVPLAAAFAVAYAATTRDALGALALMLGGVGAGYGLSVGFLRLALARRRPGDWLGWAFRGVVATVALLAANGM